MPFGSALRSTPQVQDGSWIFDRRSCLQITAPRFNPSPTLLQANAFCWMTGAMIQSLVTPGCKSCVSRDQHESKWIEMNASQMSRGTWYYTRDRLLGSFATACWDGTSEGPGAQTLTSHRWKKNNKNSSDEGRTKMRQAESTQQERGFWTRRHWCLDCLASTLPYCTAGSWRTWSFLSYCTRASWQTAASTPPVGWSSLHHCLLEKP